MSLNEALDVIQGEIMLYRQGEITICDMLGSINSVLPILEDACGEEFENAE